MPAIILMIDYYIIVGIIFVIIAALFTSLTNYVMRRSVDIGGSSKGFITIQLFFSFLMMILLNPVRLGNFNWSVEAALFGCIAGLFLGALSAFIGAAVEKGPLALSIAILNSATLFPALLLALLFGEEYGYAITVNNLIGTILVLVGLFWAGWAMPEGEGRKKWAFLALGSFLMNLLFLLFVAWWALLLKPDLPQTALLPFHFTVEKTAWFMPVTLFTAMAVQLTLYLKTERKRPKRGEVLCGVVGGLSHGASSFLLILAPQRTVMPLENALLFPTFSLFIILVSNLWAQILYKEKVNWSANGVALAGILVSAL